MDPSDLYVTGVRLSEAWFIFADNEYKEQYRDSGRNRNKTAVLEKLMKSYLIDKIMDGELLCIGMMLKPALNDFPEIVPRSLFLEPDIDWEQGTLQAFERKFAGLRVIAAAVSISAPAKDTPIEFFDPASLDRKMQPAVEDPAESTVGSVDETDGRPGEAATKSEFAPADSIASKTFDQRLGGPKTQMATADDVPDPKRRRRPSLYPYAKVVIQELIEKNKDWLDTPAVYQVDEFNKLMKVKYGNSTPPPYPIVERTLNNYKNLFRNELE
jgi:hypothetical protein